MSCRLKMAGALLPVLALASPTWAANPNSTHELNKAPMTLGPVTVVGSRTAKHSEQVPRSIEVVDADEMALSQPNDVASTLNNLPNISVTGGPRPAGKQVQIRGLSGNRILMLVDGVRQPFTKGHVGRSFVDPLLVKRVEVQRGPASVLWGSGALGGVVSVKTKNANDLLQPGQTVGARVGSGYQSGVNGWWGSGNVYGRLTERLDGMLYVSRRDNDDMELGDGNNLPWSAYRQDTALGKLTWYATDNQLLQLSHRSQRLQSTSPSNPSGVVDVENPLLNRDIATDSTRLNWKLMPYDGGLGIKAQLYHTITQVDEQQVAAIRDDHTEVARTGMDVTGSLTFADDFQHSLVFGVDGYRDSTTGKRNGAPRPMFPDASRSIAGVFVQDTLTRDWFGFSMGMRFDHYQSQSDRNVAPEQQEHELSSQFGVTLQATNWLVLYASYAEAFRAPTLEQLYATGTHFMGNHFQPNPELKPEKAANKEVGLHADWTGLFAADDHLSFDAAVFRNDVHDYIELLVKVKPLPPPLYVGGTTQSRNVNDARLEGVELSSRYSTTRWYLGVGYGQTKGDNLTTDQPLADVAPSSAKLSLGWRDLPWQGEVGLRARLVDQQDRLPTGATETPGYSVYDLVTSWHPVTALRLDLAVHNLTDKSYREHNATIKSLGRNLVAGVHWTF